MNIDGKALVKTVDVYNQNAESGKDPEFNRTKALAPLKTGPFYGIKINPGLVCHDGGLSINTKAQVLDSFDEVIPRLYAAGRDSVGIFGGQVSGQRRVNQRSSDLRTDRGKNRRDGDPLEIEKLRITRMAAE